MNTSMRAPFSGATNLHTSPERVAAIVPNVVATIMGAAFLLVGIAGFQSPGMMHAHLNWAHNIVHIVTGLAALGAGLLGPHGCARAFNVTFGAVYGLLGVLGFLLGAPGTATVGDIARDERLWAILPGTLEWGSVDHSIHVAAGLLFLISGIVGYAVSKEYREPVQD